MPPIPPWARLRRIVAGCATLALLAGCSGGVMDPVGPVGAEDSTILLDALLIMLVVAIPTILLALWVAWRYRASNTKARYLPEWSFSGRIEAVTWSIPILVILFLGGVIWIGSYKLDPFRPLASKTPPVEVQVVALDWKWLFIYPGHGVAAVNQLVIPAATPIHFSITSASVFNVFFIPRLGSMVYAMPGIVSQLNLQADRPVVLFVQSSHFSGDGFSDMQFPVKSVPPADFAAWVQAVRGAGPLLDPPAYVALARQSQHVTAFTYRGVVPGLFQAVATQKFGPGPGPEPGGPSHAGREVSVAGRP
jgi:cytochrome o ubiquinol oxidase subunit 2